MYILFSYNACCGFCGAPLWCGVDGRIARFEEQRARYFRRQMKRQFRGEICMQSRQNFQNENGNFQHKKPKKSSKNEQEIEK